MKKINIKLILSLVLVLGGLLFFISNTKVSAQNTDNLKIYTTGYSILSAQSFVFSGYYSGNVNEEDITTYFEFEKADTNTSTNINLSSSDLLKLFLKSEKDIQKTIEIERELNPEVSGVFHISPELNLFSTYYFRAVGYFNERPEEKFYGDVMTIRTGYIPIGYTYPYTYGISIGANGRPIDGVGPSYSKYNPTQIINSYFLINVTDNSAEIKTRISNTKPQDLKLKLEYGEKNFDFSSDILKIDAKGDLVATLKDLKPEKKYYFRLFDTTSRLKPSNQSFFVTKSTTGSTILASVSMDDITENSAVFNAYIYNENRQSLKLKLEYGEGELTTQSDFLVIDSFGKTSFKLTNLNSGTPYQYRLINASELFDVTATHAFTTQVKPTEAPAYVDNSNKVSGGLVPCGTERYAENTFRNKEGDLKNSKINGSYEDVSGMISNPCGFNDIFALIKKVMDYLFLGFILPVSAILFAYAGFELVTSGGDTEKKSKAKNIFINVLIGLVVSLGAFLIVKTVLNIVGFDTNAGINMFGF
ncbi:MAG: pilin [Burkholderiales bacterium]|nr:pilin [Burkholderiales bacterium]